MRLQQHELMTELEQTIDRYYRLCEMSYVQNTLSRNELIELNEIVERCKAAITSVELYHLTNSP